MNYSALFQQGDYRKHHIGLIGANGGFGYTFLAQLPLMRSSLDLRVVCDLDITKSEQFLISLGYDGDKICPCRNAEDVSRAPRDGIIVLDDFHLLPLCGIDALVEATGNPEVGAEVSEACLLAGIHVCEVSKESCSVSGAYLFGLAKKNGVVFTLVNGDQPANLIDLLSWVETLGLEVIAAGKSSEYDYVYDLENGTFTYRGKSEVIKEFKDEWDYQGTETLARRSAILSRYPQQAVPDYCEMGLVADATGLVPSCGRFHYPICRVSELADIYIPQEDGGVLEKTGVVDVFNNLRRPDEASFAGGVFVIVRCHDPKVWDIIQEKGHVVGKNGKYACIYLPYHYMGVEAPMTVLLACRLGLSSNVMYRNATCMAGRTRRPFRKGEVLSLNGQHRVVDDVDVSLVLRKDISPDVAPYYLFANKKLVADVPAGVLITTDMIELSGSSLFRMFGKS